MPRRSKTLLSPVEFEELNSQLCTYIASLQSSKDVDNFLNEFWTEEEKIMFIKRLALYSLLYSNRDLDFIQQTLGISYETVRLYNSQKYNKSINFQNEMRKIAGKRKSIKIWEKLEGKLAIVDDIMNSNHDMGARYRLLTGDTLTPKKK